MSVYVGNTTTNTVITLTSISQSGKSGQVIPSGANITFHQSTAPVGFTKITVYDDYSMRVVSGSVANKTNGVAFTSAFVSQSIDGSVGSTTLTS